jgi:BCD family chlorophyll transporter-like MFS transporter
MPEFSQDAMQQLYTLTPFVVMVLGVLSVLGLEKRRSKEELAALQEQDAEKMMNKNPVGDSLRLLTKNPTAQKFFLFIALCFMGIFSQDLLQEILAGEVFQMSVGESTVFQQIFNSTVTIGMAMTAAFGARIVGMPQLKTPVLPLEKRKTLAAYSGLGATLSFLLISLAIAQAHLAGLYAAMAFNGLCVGVFAFCAVTMMSDMTVENETGRYLGLWSIAQAIGLGASFLVSGVLHHWLVRSGIFSSAAIGYAVIFLIEAGFMLWCVLALRPTSIENLRLQAVPRQSATA